MATLPCKDRTHIEAPRVSPLQGRGQGGGIHQQARGAQTLDPTHPTPCTLRPKQGAYGPTPYPPYSPYTLHPMIVQRGRPHTMAWEGRQQEAPHDPA